MGASLAYFHMLQEPTTQSGKLPSGVEPTTDFECVYIPSAELGPVDDPEASLKV